MRHPLSVILFAALASACEAPEPPPRVLYPVPAPYETRVEVRPETRIVVGERESTKVEEGWALPAPAVQVGIVITTARKLERPTEIVGVIDAHEPSGRQDAALALLRRRAAEMGADAVVGVEFHHGDEKDEPTHLSGLAVRYADHLR